MLFKPIVLAVFSALVVQSPTPPAVDSNAFPSVVMIRGGELKEPLVIHHLYKNGFENDPIVRLYVAIRVGEHRPIPPETVEYDVAEFWGPQWVRKYGTDGRPIAGLKFEDATSFAKMYIGANSVFWIRGSAYLSNEDVLPRIGTAAVYRDIMSVLYEAGLSSQRQ